MTEVNHRIKSIAVRSAIYMVVLALLTTGVMMLPHLDLPVDSYREGGVLEGLQLWLLFIALLTLALAGYRYRRHLQLTFVLASFLAAAFCRECDSLLEHYLFDHCWQVTVIAILLTTIIVTARQLRPFMDSVRKFVNWSSFGMMLSGFLIVFVFSRIMGHNEYWESMVEGYESRAVARVVEESTEFLGYFLLLIGALEYALTMRKLCPRKAVDKEPAEEPAN